MIKSMYEKVLLKECRSSGLELVSYSSVYHTFVFDGGCKITFSDTYFSVDADTCKEDEEAAKEFHQEFSYEDIETMEQFFIRVEVSMFGASFFLDYLEELKERALEIEDFEYGNDFIDFDFDK